MEMEKLIADNLGLVYDRIHAMRLSTHPDAESDGLFALYRAAATYNPSSGVKFSTYAYTCIFNALANILRKQKTQPDMIYLGTTIITEDSDHSTKLDFMPSSEDIERDFLSKERSNVIDLCFDIELNLLAGKKKQIVDIWREEEFAISKTDIGRKVGVSQAYVNQVLANFRYSLKQRLENNYGEYF